METAITTAHFATVEQAREARARLEQAGFARNSVDIQRENDNDVAVVIHTRAENRDRAASILTGRRRKRAIAADIATVAALTFIGLISPRRH